MDIYPYFKTLFDTDYDFAGKMAHDLELEPNEIAFILSEKENSDDVKKILELKESYSPQPKNEEKPTIIIEEKKKEVKTQRNLFDF